MADTRYDAAVRELHQTPHASFVAERKRLAGELKAAGDKTSAARLAKLPRPTISAWVVNQLWWHARDAFDAMFESAEKLRAGRLDASGPHREAIARLRARATAILGDAGHATTESTLRRVTTTLAALAAAGSFDPDSPGALAADRDPPGFEALGIAPGAEDEAPAAAGPAPAPAAASTTRVDRDAAAKREQAEAAAERKRAERAEAERRTQQHRLEAALRAARTELARRTKQRDRLRKAADDADRAVAEAQARLDALGDGLH